MASRSPLADPSRFIISVAVGFRHVMEPVLGFLERVPSTHMRNPVLVVLVIWLVLVAPFAYFLLVIVVFVVCVAADGYTRIVERGSNNVHQALEQAATALSPAAVLGWLGNVAIKVAVSFLIFGIAVYMIGDARRS